MSSESSTQKNCGWSYTDWLQSREYARDAVSPSTTIPAVWGAVMQLYHHVSRTSVKELHLRCNTYTIQHAKRPQRRRYIFDDPLGRSSALVLF